MPAATHTVLRGLPNLFSLAGKTAVITGASGGMATTLSRYLIHQGVESLALLDMKQDSLTKTKEFLEHDHKENGGSHLRQITTWPCDISDQPAIHDVMKEIRAANDAKLDVLVNTAGYCENISALDYPADNIKKLLDVNLAGSMIVASEFARTVISDLHSEEALALGANPSAHPPAHEDTSPSSVAAHNPILGTTASIILVGSMSGHIINHPQFQTPYNMSKAGVIHLAKSLASEWSQYGIRVNSLSPGYIATPLTKAILEANPVLKAKWEGQIPVGRMADPAEFAGPVMFMASDASSYMTGTDIIVDGGYCIR